MGIPSGWELILVLLVLVLLFGSRKLPQMAEGLGKSLRIFKRETSKLSGEEDTTVTQQQDTTDKPAAAPPQLPPSQTDTTVNGVPISETDQNKSGR